MIQNREEKQILYLKIYDSIRSGEINRMGKGVLTSALAHASVKGEANI